MSAIVIILPECSEDSPEIAKAKARERDAAVAWFGGRPPRSRPMLRVNNIVVDNDRKKDTS